MNIKHSENIFLTQERHLQKLLCTLATIFSNLVILTGLLDLVGWAAGIEVLKRPIAHLVAMNPLTAICFIMLGAGVLLYNRRLIKSRAFLSYTFAFSTMGVGIIKLLGLALGWQPSIDELLFADTLKKDALNNLSNGMAANTALNFVLIAASLLLVNSGNNKKRIWAHILAMIVGLVAILSIIGYLYEVGEFYGALKYMPMSLHTACAFLLLCLAILFIDPNSGLVGRIMGPFAVSVPKFILLHAAVLVPFISGLVIIRMHDAELLGLHLAIAILVVGIMLAFFALVWYSISLLNKNEAYRKAAENTLVNRTEELAVANSSLKSSNVSLEEFTFVASHDLQEPLRKIITFGNLLADKLQDGREPEKALIGRMQQSAQRMSMLISSILAYSKVTQPTVTSEHVNLNLMIDEVLSDLEAAIKTKQATISVSALQPVIGNTVQLKQVFQNLLTNALKFSTDEKSPQISIAATAIGNLPGNAGKKVFQQIEVADNGIGFEQQYSEKIFQQFQRLNNVAAYPGSGIGLSIVKKIIENHGGSISVKSQPGVGTTFIMQLPVKE